MNQKIKHFYAYTIIFSSCLFVSSLTTNCTKKDKAELQPAPSPSNVKQSDQSGSSAADGVMEDVNNYINNKIGGGNNLRLDSEPNDRLEVYNLPCGIIRIDTSTTPEGHKNYRMQYGDYNSCTNKRKSGEVAFQLVNGTAFNEAGSIFKITYTDYVVEIVSTKDVVKINGSLYITNVNGGYVWESVTKSSSIQHRVRGTFAIEYANGAIRQRHYYQLRTWSSSSGVQGLTFSVAGDTTINSVHVTETGNTFDGNYSFVTQMLTNYTWSNCSDSYAGPYILKVGNARMNVTVPSVYPAYFNVEAGYYYSTAASSTPLLVNDCSTNAYKIDIVLGTTTSTQYQLY